MKKSAITVHPIRSTASNGMHSHLSLAVNEIEADTHTNTQRTYKQKSLNHLKGRRHTSELISDSVSGWFTVW